MLSMCACEMHVVAWSFGLEMMNAPVVALSLGLEMLNAPVVALSLGLETLNGPVFGLEMLIDCPRYAEWSCRGPVVWP